MKTKRLLAVLLTVALVVCAIPLTGAAKTDPLKPADNSFDIGLLSDRIILSKTAVRTAADMWNVTLTVQLKKIAIIKQICNEMIVDPMGAYVQVSGTPSVSGASPSTANVQNNQITWSPADGTLGKAFNNRSMTMTYTVKLKDGSLAALGAGKDREIALNGDAKLNYQICASNSFPKPKDYIDIGKLDVEYKISSTSNNVPGAPTFTTQYTVTDWGTPVFTVGASYRPATIADNDGNNASNYVLKSAKYDGSSIDLANIASISAKSGSHKLTLYYEYDAGVQTVSYKVVHNYTWTDTYNSANSGSATVSMPATGWSTANLNDSVTPAAQLNYTIPGTGSVAFTPDAANPTGSVQITQDQQVITYNYTYTFSTDPGDYNYSVYVRYILSGSSPESIISGPTLYESGSLKIGQTKDVTVTPSIPSGYLSTDTPAIIHVADVEGGDFTGTATYYVAPVPPELYPYTVHYVYYLDGALTTSVSKDDYNGTALAGSITLANDGGATDGSGNVYGLGNTDALNVVISPEGGNSFTLSYYATTGTQEQTESPDITRPPQVVTPTPTPSEEIIVPPEEIPTDVPSDVPDDVQVDDEEIPTDVPQTGESNPLLPGLALVLIAGAALVLTVRKSRKHD